MTAVATELRMVWRGKQSAAILDATRYLDLEGAIRSSKTTIGLWKVLNSCLDHDGIRWLVSRWIDDDVNALLKPLLRLMFEQAQIEAAYFAEEHRFELPNGSWIYLRGLRPSENQSRFSKFRGMTLAGVLVDQAEEIPEDFYLELKGRLSQPGYPHQMILTPNPPGEDHWLAREFPDTESGAPVKAQHKYIRLSLFDNAHNLDPGYVAQLQVDYPEGHPMRRRLIEGRRGLNVKGKPVYAGYFVRARHVDDLTINPDVPLVECIDFGHHHPCVVWLQFLPWGALSVLGGLMGEDLFIEDFAPLLVQQRAEWFPSIHSLQTVCDPAGSHQNSQGTRLSGVTVLRDHGLTPRWVDNSNMPEVRSAAIQAVAGYMRRRTVRGGEAFQVDRSRWRIISAREARFSSFYVDGLEAGYVWDERVRSSASGKKIIVPMKDGYYEHGQNCLEYGQINCGPARLTMVNERKLEQQAQAAITRKDHDPYDARRRPAAVGRRGGW